MKIAGLLALSGLLLAAGLMGGALTAGSSERLSVRTLVRPRPATPASRNVGGSERQTTPTLQRPDTQTLRPVVSRVEPPSDAPVELPPVDVRGRMATADVAEYGAIEQEWELRLLQDPAFAGRLFEAFRDETDPMKMSFLQNILAGSPAIRNDPAWQDNFLAVAENGATAERGMPALLFLQQAERIDAVRDRLYALAERGGGLRANALITLKGMPDRRPPDPRLAETAGRIADTERDPRLRGLALRIEEHPAHAVRFLSDPEKEVRLQAAQVVTDVAAVERALATEQDPEAKSVLQGRIDQLQSETRASPGAAR